MKMRGYILVPIIGLLVSVLMYLKFGTSMRLDLSAESSFDYLRHIGGWLPLVFMCSPYLAIAAIIYVAQAYRWSLPVQRASVATNLVITVLSAFCYTFLAAVFWRQPQHEGIAWLLILMPFWSWCAMLGLWIAAYLFYRLKHEKTAA
jgi:hypothetical protein